MTITIRQAVIADARILKEIQRKAFMADLLRYNDHDINPGNEPIERIKYKIRNFNYFAILIDNNIVGGAMVTKKKDSHYRLNRIYLDPVYHNKGVGRTAIRLIEETFADAKVWELDTPMLNIRNQHLYESMGYKKIGENQIRENLILFEYRKEV